MVMEDYKKEFIKFMVRSNVLTFGDFTTKSGRKTPYFVNTGNYVTGAQMQKLGDFYAQCIKNMGGKVDVLFGPAYKGIPLSVAAAIALNSRYDDDVSYCFNRKEAKDHGEGGTMVGYKLLDGDNVLIIEDVVTAGTSVRECLPILRGLAKVNIAGLIVSVDRMEKGKGDKTAIQELHDEFGISTYPIVTVREIIDTIYNVEIDGKVYIDDVMKKRMEEYFEMYCVN
jgi:orotate phosphoribosyltransferase